MNSRLERLLVNYQPNEVAVEAANEVKTLFLVGISGAGKDTLQQKLIEGGDYHQIVSHTTRSPRKNHGILEKDGVDYHFISLEKAADMLDSHEFIEAKYYSGNVYGTSVAEFQKAAKEKKIAIGDIEIQGVAEYKAIAPDSVHPVFVLPPSYAIWQQRWHKRWGDDSDNAAKKLRMKTAIAEIDHVLGTGYYYLVINDDIDEAVKQINDISKHSSQSDALFDIGRQTAQEILTAIKEQVSTL